MSYECRGYLSFIVPWTGPESLGQKPGGLAQEDYIRMLGQGGLGQRAWARGHRPKSQDQRA